jgi:hypothetical protein
MEQENKDRTKNGLSYCTSKQYWRKQDERQSNATYKIMETRKTEMWLRTYEKG